MAPQTGFEPVTSRLTADCSTAELLGNIGLNLTRVYYETLVKSQNFFREKCSRRFFIAGFVDFRAFSQSFYRFFLGFFRKKNPIPSSENFFTLQIVQTPLEYLLFSDSSLFFEEKSILFQENPLSAKHMKHLNIHIQKYEKNGEIILGEIHKIVNENDRIALIGPNGVGKSTFMKILSNQIEDYEWGIENIGNLTLGYLEQIHFADTTKSVRDELRDAFAEIRRIERELRVEEEYMESGDERFDYELYTNLLESYNLLGGYTYDNDIERVSRGLAIFHLLEKPLAEVSGGERTKIALAKILLSKPNFLLLDEPTNFIDLPSVEWLEKYLTDTWKWGYLIVSHDREFLDETCGETIEMLGVDGIREYAGSYSFSVAEKKKQELLDEKYYEEQQTFIEWEKKLINRFRAGSRAWWAKSRERALEKVEILEKPKTRRLVKFSFAYDKHGPENPLKIEDAFIGRQEPLFFVRHAELSKGERIGIVGENGVGKSTLLKTILKQIKPLEWLVQLHENTKILYFSQMHETLDADRTILENFASHGLLYPAERVGGILESYGFEYMDHSKKVGSLSGGERSRLLFAMLSENSCAWKNALQKPENDANSASLYEKYDNSNLLILDEPTNHLDADTREALEKALSEYPGVILFISHDRYFVNKLAKKIWIVEWWELSVSYGNYEDYQFKKERGLDFDMSLFDLDGEMDLVLEEKLWATEARRIKEKFARKKASRRR